MIRVQESIRDMLAREAEDARAVAAAEDAGKRTRTPGQRARKQAKHPAQVYSVRIPVDRLEQLRRLAEQRGVAPTVLMRQFVLGALDAQTEVTTEAADPQLAAQRFQDLIRMIKTFQGTFREYEDLFSGRMLDLVTPSLEIKPRKHRGFVVPAGSSGWVVESEDHHRLSVTLPTQNEALIYAEALVRGLGGGEVVVKARTGKVKRSIPVPPLELDSSAYALMA